MPALMRRRTGFTIIELLIVVLIIGILASVAIAKFGESKRRAYLTAMKSDLRGLATIAESRYTSDNSYESVVAPQGSDGVTLTFTGTVSGWSGTATHVGVPGVLCTIAAGSSLAANAPSEPVCQ
ncbi:type IV pilin protein [Gemmatimonas groenlandica]|uniref:Prepilin-type N-terminal cleavage/methylation domain-containing protein n=1 Tax=Gemmatimonas groenlandica TaxID=2732249 RepID=A0A6M4IHR7_9BACT|nr:prepilin-type N-terminal cleavage/methylation domain-containing protein [Gemmatimonas groenlandica]QJR34343.1 prepilin-type N-terminal cleavage/methylation domain-containing protein [Gemmatimonas groenlandica]